MYSFCAVFLTSCEGECYMLAWGCVSTFCLILAHHWSAKGCFNSLPAAVLVVLRIK